MRVEVNARDLRDVLGAVSRELVYRTDKGAIMRQVRAGQNRRCDKAVRQLLALGLVEEPAEGASYFGLTDMALAHLDAEVSA